MKYILSLFFVFGFAFAVCAQTETLTNGEIILMTKAGLSKELIARKIKDSNGRYETTAQSLIELKKSGVADAVIALMMDKRSETVEKVSLEPNNRMIENITESGTPSVESNAKAHIVLDAKEAFRGAKTIAITKSTLNPSRQALEKELLKNTDWRRLNLNIVRYKQDADLYIEIGFVPLSIITHRYVFRIYDNKSGTVIAAGETTSWGSLAENLARSISKKLAQAAGS